MITIPTISELYTGVKSKIESEFGISIPVVGKSYLRVRAAVQAAKLKILYLTLASVQKNSWVDTAEPEASGGTLERYGRVKLGRDPFPARAGVYSVHVTGTTGAEIRANTTFKSDDNSQSPGKMFVLDTAFTLDGTNIISLRALEAGTDSSLAIGNTLTPTAPIALVNSTATVTAITTSPADAEDTEAYRAATIAAFQTETQGGAVGDYRVWSADAQGVASVYPYAKSGSPSEINLYVEATEDDSTDGKGTPGQTILDDVESVIELDPDTTKDIDERGRRPLGAVVSVLPVSVLDVTIQVQGYEDLTATIQAGIESALDELVTEIRPYISGADAPASKNNILDKNRIVYSIQSAYPASVFTGIVLTVDGSTVDSYEFTDGNIPYLLTVSF